MTVDTAPAYRIDDREVAREAFYAVACDPRRNVIVEACAGAGKTWMLVSRILRALLDGAEPHEILAITFTRKAAGEMRERLSQWLRQHADGSPAQRVEALVARGVDPAAAAALAPALQRLHERVLAGGRAVEVRTFHAWFSQLLRAAPLELLSGLGLQPRMELIEDVDELRPELFRRFHAALLRDAERRDDYTALLHRHGRHNLLAWLQAGWHRRIDIELADEAGTLMTSVPDTTVVWPPTPPFAELAARLGASRGKRARDAAQAIEAALGLAGDEAVFEALWDALHTKEGEPRKQLGDLPEQVAACALLRRTRDLLDQRLAHHDHLRMARLSRVLFAEYALLKRLRSLADMPDLERLALAVLGDGELAGWMQERLDARVRHLLIDEFQDTSPLQWRALQSWLSSYAGAGGGQGGPSVFIVGDPKQSIYRFRGAEPRVFDAARDFLRLALQGRALSCDHTRRNAPGVLAALNGVFGALTRDGLYPGFREHTTDVAGDGGEVARLPGALRQPQDKAAPAPGWRPSLTTPRREPEEVLREEEARQVAASVLELVRRGMRPGSIFVLSRKRASLRLAADALQALHLPFAAPEETPLGQLPEVRDLVALLDVLASPGHDLSLAQALRSPLFAASDADLLALATQARERRVSWSLALQEASAPSPALARAAALLAAWAEAARALPPHDLLDRVIAEGDFMARLAATVPAERRQAALAAVDALLGHTLQLDGGRYATPYNFVRALRSRLLKAPIVAQPDAVQLLTVHGAKGLEADTVFVMDADPEAQNPQTMDLLVEWPVESAHPRRVAFVASEARCALSLRGLLSDEQAAREREEYNSLYVAMTRARERLVFSRTEPFRALERAAWWPRVAPYALELPLPVPGGAATADGADVELPVLPEAPPQRAQAPADATPDDPASRLGQALHRALEWAGRPGQQRPLAALAAAAAAEFGLDTAQGASVGAIARRVLDAPALARFFDPAGLLWAGNEVPVTGERGQALRIDRLVRTPDAWWVLDYKLHHTPQEMPLLREQLARYRAAVQRLQPGEPVRAAFITGAGELVEVGPAD